MKTVEKYYLWLILFLALVLRLINLNQSFWLDEAAQMIESARPFFNQFEIAADFHPPLYHLLLHFWLIFGNSEIFVRIPGVILGVISVYLLYKIALLLNFKRSALLLALFLAVSPFHIYYSQEVRPYMLFSFLSLVSAYFWLKSRFREYTLINILLLYTNYFATFFIFGQLFTALLLRKKIFFKNLKSLGVSYLFLIPWIPKLFEQLKTGLGGAFNGWTQVVSESALKLIPLTFAKFIIGKASFDNNFIYFLVLLPVILVFLYFAFMNLKNFQGRLLLSLFFSSLLLAFAISLFLPVAAPQRLIFLLPLFLLIIASGLNMITGLFYYLSIFSVLSVLLIGLGLYYFNPRFQREDWRGSVNYLNNRVSKDHLVLMSFPDPFAPFIWYNRGILNARGIAPGFRVTLSDLDRIKEELTAKKEIYYYGYLTDLTDPDKKVQNFLSKSGFNLKGIKDFHGVGFLYEYEK